ncbi:hypothetical protein GJAV_G00109840 [Gymnothorax javanicus]|nr:hypothetical protein GJAV_G00109840 [Gymnothorax javanicus]
MKCFSSAVDPACAPANTLHRTQKQNTPTQRIDSRQTGGLHACKRKEQEQHKDRNLAPKKQRLVFTDLQRRTLIAIFKENKRPSKEMQHTISQQLGLELSTVSNFFMNARRRCVDRWHDEHAHPHPHGASPAQPGTSATTFSKA